MAILLPLIQSSSRNLCSKAARNALQIEGVVAPRKPMVACLAQLRCRVNSRDAIYPSHDVALATSAGGRLKPLKLLARESIVKVGTTVLSVAPTGFIIFGGHRVGTPSTVC